MKRRKGGQRHQGLEAALAEDKAGQQVLDAVYDAERLKRVKEGVERARNRRAMKSLTLIGRRWFRRGPGGTYCTVEIIVDGEHVHKSKPTGGYDDHYVTIAYEWLVDNGYLDVKRHDNGSLPPLWQVCQDRGISLTRSVSDVAREKDL